MPDAGCTREPCVQESCTFTHASNNRFSRDTRHSPRNGFTAYTWSPRCTGLDGHRRLRIITANLIPASGDRDNTISPSARHHSSADAAASIASRAQRFVTTAKRASGGTGRREYSSDLRKCQALISDFSIPARNPGLQPSENPSNPGRSPLLAVC